MIRTTFAILALLVCPAAHSESATPDGETRRWIVTYLRSNGLSPDTDLRVGMRVGDLKRILGEPNWNLAGHRTREQHSKVSAENTVWLGWYHNPRQRHVAPFIRARIKDGVVTELQAGRR